MEEPPDKRRPLRCQGEFGHVRRHKAEERRGEETSTKDKRRQPPLSHVVEEHLLRSSSFFCAFPVSFWSSHVLFLYLRVLRVVVVQFLCLYCTYVGISYSFCVTWRMCSCAKRGSLVRFKTHILFCGGSSRPFGFFLCCSERGAADTPRVIPRRRRISFHYFA